MQSSQRNLNIAGLLFLTAGLLVAGPASALDPSEGLVPTVQVVVPNLDSQTYKTVAPSFTVEVVGLDADSPTGRPAKFRMLLITAQYDETPGGDPIYITTPAEFDLYAGDLLWWDDPDWSVWFDYPAAPEAPPIINYNGLIDGVYYLLAAQVMDADGAVSIALNYQEEVFHFQVREDFFYPEVVLYETYLGVTSSSSSMNDIAAGQPLNFSWVANGDAYGGTIVSYRHGWDLIDPDDPNDPGWAVQPGLEPANMFAAERSFQDGLHTFFLRVEDDSQQVRLLVWQLSVVPYVEVSFQLPLLIIDQTVDSSSLAWPDQSGYPMDNEDYRNPYWQFLDGVPGGVTDFSWSRDWLDHTQQVNYRDLVNYRAVLCYARNHPDQTMFSQFRPVAGQDKYVWLAPYQQAGGNYFQVGDGSMESFLEMLPNYMIPIIFDTNETEYVIGGSTYIVGFGQKELPDGTLIPRGPTMYSYATAGIAALDWTSPSTKTIYGRDTVAALDRRVDCVGLKGLALAPDFRANHAVGAAAIADTFFTDQVIDWHDVVDAGAGSLDLFSNTFPFRNDEFVDFNISSRTTPLIPQECAVGPGGMCVEPMFTGISRMDWMREYMWDDGDPDWPYSQYTGQELDDGCGPLALTQYEGIPQSSGRTNGRTYGYFSYKMFEDKPSGKADVYWGFDPYRFDHDETQKAIRWVLDYFGLQINQ